MRWRINGADRKNAKSRELWIDARSELEARELASEMGVIVSSALPDPPVVVNVPRQVELNRRQMKLLRVTEMRIASGVCLALIMWGLLCGVTILAIIAWTGYAITTP